MVIRPIEATELNELLALYRYLHTTDDPLPDQKVLQSVWQDLLKSPCYQYFGSYVNDDLIASCNLTIIPNLTRGCKPYGVIENVVTHAEHRHQGHGKALLKHALSHAWSVGCYKVMLMTGRKDQETLNFYESAGFDRHEKQALSPNRRLEMAWVRMVNGLLETDLGQ